MKDIILKSVINIVVTGITILLLILIKNNG